MTARWLSLELCLPPQVLPEGVAGALAVPRARGPVLKSGLVWEPLPCRAWTLAVQPQPGVSCAPAHALQHVTTLHPACRAVTPLGMNLPGPSVSLCSLGDTPMAVGSQSSQTQTSVQWTCSMSGHPLPPASAVFQRLSCRGDEAELCVLALFSGSGLEGCGCLRRGHTSYLLPGGPPCPTLPLPPPLRCSCRVSSCAWKTRSAPLLPTGGL